MDCEKFDRVVLDLLYEELDELTAAAATRHRDQCARCRDIAQGLRATREVGVLPLVEPPDDLEERILEGERLARWRVPWRQRARRATSVLAGYAMRPQLAMAALFLLMIGSSLLFLRARPGDRDSVRVTERGVPELESESVAVVPLPERAAAPPAEPTPEAPAAKAKRRSAESDDEPTEAPGGEEFARELARDEGAPGRGDANPVEADYEEALSLYHGGRYAEAVPRLDSVATRGGANAPSASLFAAQATRVASGCRAATPRFETVNAKFSGSGVAHEATWQAADCYRVMGDVDRARRKYESLVTVAGYGDRAKRALVALGSPSALAAAPHEADSLAGEEEAARKAGAKAAPAKAAAPAKPAATRAPAAEGF